MRSGILLVFMLSGLAAPLLAAKPAAKTAAPAKLIQSCDAHKFETVVGQSKVKLCGVEGQSDAEWIGTLKDAIAKLEANKEMPPAQREQIVTAIKAEIARLEIVGSAPPPRRTARAAPASPEAALSRDYPMLPPMPPPRQTPTAPVQQDVAGLSPIPQPPQTPSRAVAGEGAQLTPVPAPPPVSVPAVAAASLIPPVAPRLKFGCDTPGDLSTDAPCAEFERETTLNIHAVEDVPTGTSLQFVRNDRPQADVALDGLRRGKMMRIALPAKVCSGFTSGKLELRIVRDDGSGVPQSLSSDGPYSLRC